MWRWLKKLFKKEEKEVVYVCPKCGSSDIGYFTGLINYIQVITGQEHPRYGQSAKCNTCGFRTEVYEDDEDLYLNELRKVYRNANR